MRLIPLLALAAGCIPQIFATQHRDGEEEVDDYVWEMPSNSWPISEPPEALQPEGFDTGQVALDLRLKDQHGDQVSLWQFYGNVVVLDVATMWCPPCQKLAEGTEETNGLFHDDGFTYISVLQEGFEGDPPARPDLNEWGDAFGITSPILADPDYTADGAVKNGQYPGLIIIGRDLVVTDRVHPPTDDALRDAVRDAL